LIGLDTNVLLRGYLSDDPTQSPLAKARMIETAQRGETMLVRDVVLAEFVRVLASAYRYDARQIIAAVHSILDSAGLVFEDEHAVEEALGRAERDRVDFADALIAIRNSRDGCSFTLSFDKQATRMADVMLLEA
jgi:predicted nucleic-acid-binding protein